MLTCCKLSCLPTAENIDVAARVEPISLWRGVLPLFLMAGHLVGLELNRLQCTV